MPAGHHGVQPWNPKPSYATYKSPYGPKTKVPLNFSGVDAKALGRFGITAGSFGVAAGLFAMFFFSDVPRFRKDIMQKFPIIGDHYVREIPVEDNPF